jgi:conjugative transposon TraM protein
MDDYARELENIQNRSRARQRAFEESFGGSSKAEEEARRKDAERIKAEKEKKAKAEKPEIVKKVADAGAEKFNTIDQQKEVDEPLIKAMIDKTTKAHEGTRLRFKLLDDVMIKNVKLKKGTYLYGIVTGFGQQRVMATITSILVKDKFVKVNLSVYDNDGMEGFYVPESAFRDMMKDAGAQAMQNNISFNGGYDSELSGEAIALQALQNMYQSASNAISGNIRKNKAKIKYNTIVYLINADALSGN